MKSLQLYSKKDIEHLTRKRTNEIKIGEDVILLKSETNWETELQNSSCKFVLLGIPEDVGVKANYGRGGAHTAWKPALDSFLSQQSNEFLNGKEVCVLGHIFVEDVMEKADSLQAKNKNDMAELRNLVSIIDTRVTDVITKIIADCTL